MTSTSSHCIIQLSQWHCYLLATMILREPEFIFVKVIPGALSETKTSIEEKLREISPHYLNPVSSPLRPD